MIPGPVASQRDPVDAVSHKPCMPLLGHHLLVLADLVVLEEERMGS